MKITAFLWLFGFLQLSANTYSQTISLSGSNLTMREVVDAIRKQTEYGVTGDRAIMSERISVNIHAEDMPLRDFLDVVLKDRSVGYTVENKTIFLTKIDKRIRPSRQTRRPLEDYRTQEKIVAGGVTDSLGNPLVGVTVAIKSNPSHVTTTDQNGRYTLNVPLDAVLVFSMVGFDTQEINSTGKEVVDVVLSELSTQLDDVVVTAFGGSSKRTDMVGSVTSIRPDELKVPSSNLTTALAGRAAGIIAYQRSGEPGQDNADFFVRGVTTFGYKTSPLILIDGIELTATDLARLQPDDISSFSIMKDATSTAVYGARGANGVILVTTKGGAVGPAKLAIRLENSISAPTQNVELADPITYMEMGNEAVRTRDPLGAIRYSDEKIAKTRAGANPYIYPANDWRALLFKEYTTNQRVNLNISGGGGVARYFVSGSFNNDNGILKVDRRNNFNNNISLKSYMLRSNVTIDLTKTSELTVRLSGNFDDYNGPIDGGTTMFNKVMRSNPVLFPAYYPADDNHQYVNHIMFGNYDQGTFTNPYADMVKGYKEYSRSLMQAQFEVKQNLRFITDGLSFRTMLNTNRTAFFDVNRFYNPFFYTLSGYDQLSDAYRIKNVNPEQATEYLGYSEGPKLISSSFYLESMLNYDRTLNDKHGLSGLLVYIMRQELNANAGDLQLSLPFRNLGLSGRATYNYGRRYYFEFNFGYNGSERFYKTNRFGFFPSAGIAWSISNEKFFEPIKEIVSNLRLRATYGMIGNDAIGAPRDRFFYLSNVNMNDGSRGAVFGNGIGTPYRLSGVSISRYANNDITWETAVKRNLALELGLFNKLDIQMEYFWEDRRNILMDRSTIPPELGFAAPIRANVGEASGKGIDASLDYQHAFYNGLWLSARGNFTYASSKYKVFDEAEYDEWYRSRIGHSIYQTYGYIAERLFVDDTEAINSPQQFGEYGGGDIKYLDVNADGRISEADMVPIGNPILPEIVYGFGFSLGYKGMDISAFFQGLSNSAFWIDAGATSPFQNETQVLKAYADSYWSEDRRDVHALWPRLSPTINQNNVQPNTWFMRDGSFLRLKQVEFGYSLPAHILSRISTNNLRVYLNATNLISFSKFKLWDVEMGGNGLGYPLQRVFNIGINMTFN
ncbi:TonB-dependent receptor [Parapedobacter sp. 10938]|nr:TonB-dependent receptor [Parapedobacter sp. 10938]